MEKASLPALRVEGMIHVVRGQRVMLSTDLAHLYGVEPKVLVQAVKRNMARFPPDFMFPLERQEAAILKSQIVTSSWGGARRASPYAFTEQGVAMLSSVLRSTRAVQVNIAIMRAFVRLREAIATHGQLTDKLAELEKRMARGEEGIQTLFEAIRQLMAPPNDSPKRIGFHVRERRARYVRRR